MKRTHIRATRLVAASAALGLALTCGTAHAAGKPSKEPKGSLTQYALSPGLLKITGGRTAGNPTQVHGVLGMPKGKGPHPVAVVMHGAHHNCVTAKKGDGITQNPVKTAWPLVCAKPGKKEKGVGPDYLRQDAGLSHVVEALTRKGFVAVSIDVVSPEIWWGGETDPVKGYTDLVDAHLRLLSDLNKGVSHGLKIPDVKGRIDTSRVGLVGHSRGGGYVLSQKAAQRKGLFGAVAIEPAEYAEKATHKVPVLNIRGGCDEDTGPDAGLTTVKGLAKSGRTKVAADVLLPGAGHTMMNTNLAPARKDGSVGECKRAKVAKPAAARDQVAQLTAAFLEQALHKAGSYRLPAVKGLAPKGGNLRKGGPAVTFREARPETYADPHRIRETVSKERLLPAIPKTLKVNKTPDAGI
ncbi:alpha/beta hydrolase [Streptomyces sp. AV19]|uniref:dienelactone hydrolase family protein n=1 Tax=Streptomyces sp. AV19 TaxID=2793068 RepID=UPI0018FEF430|nr:alpha/beta hydrolase [Streptomyces sp. AV19]MBH1934669.1 alpha/beta hydrolase [Streptomyces sp. AV19]MDG4530793.1 alpha/beta hydrolase [Streptomyces sp. AV19]